MENILLPKQNRLSSYYFNTLEKFRNAMEAFLWFFSKTFSENIQKVRNENATFSTEKHLEFLGNFRLFLFSGTRNLLSKEKVREDGIVTNLVTIAT